MGLKGINFKNFLIVFALSIVLNLFLSGPEAFKKRLISFYEKPELTVYPLKCVLGACLGKTAKCFMDTNCRNTINCIEKCTSNERLERVAGCAYTCEMTHGYENEYFLDEIKCLVNNGCLTRYPRDGICHGNDNDGIANLKSLDQVKGDWWVVRGLNCGQNDDYPGGYDWYPCQHERFIKESNGQWINRVTYCDGKADKCMASGIIETIANVSLPAPGVVQHDYTDAPLSPQVEKWRIVSWPNEGDYLMMLWCGNLPILEYNGGIFLSRHRSDKDMPESTLEEFKKMSKKHGIPWSEWCPSNNEHCTKYPEDHN